MSQRVGESAAPVCAVRVELYGVPRLTACRRAVELPYQEAATLGAVVRALGARLPLLVGPVITPDGDALHEGYLFNVNGRDFVADRARRLAPGDTVLLLSAAAGG